MKGVAEFVHHYEEGTPGAAALLLLHGTGGDEHDLLPLGREVAPGAGLLAPRGQVLENGMPRFFRRLAMGVFDEKDLIERTHELADFVAAAAAQYGFPAGSVMALGFSNGANIAAAMLLLRPEALAGAVLLRPMVPLEPEVAPDLAGREVLIVAGRMDPTVPPGQSEQLATMLRAAGAAVSLHWSQAGHNLAQEDLLLAQRGLWDRIGGA
jgi:phospholipase/carboxylesterase